MCVWVESVCSRTRSGFLNSVSCTSIMKDAVKLIEKIKGNKDDSLTEKLPLGSFSYSV